MSLQAWFNRLWYERPRPPPWLVPLSGVYAAAAALRRAAYRRGWRVAARLSRPVVVVGNLSAGGTGKTPLVGWIAARLAANGRHPGIVTRGYRGSARGARLIGPGDDPAVVGDEPLLLARRTGVPVAIGRARPAAARLLIGAGCDVILSDDGLQHYALARDCEIAVIDGVRRFGNRRLLPAGPLREPVRRLASVDAVVVNGGTPAGGEFAMRLTAASAVSLRGGAVKPLRAFAGTAVHALAGIAHPERFFAMLRALHIEVIAHALDDHARLGAGDIRFADQKPVLMTEKDAVKCRDWADDRHWCVPVDVQFAADDAHALVGIILRRIAAHQRRDGEVQRG